MKTDFPAVTSDYLPTILSVLNLNYPDNRPIDGISLTEVLNGKITEREKPIGFQYPGKMSWVTQEYKLISADKGETFELYNLVDDPAEQNNIAFENTELANKMKTDLLIWIESCKASENGADY